jgi:hypothetical protein
LRFGNLSGGHLRGDEVTPLDGFITVVSRRQASGREVEPQMRLYVVLRDALAEGILDSRPPDLGVATP